MRQAVIFCAGSVGRGFLGQLLCDAGWFVTFLDVDPVLVAALRRDREYRHVTVGDGKAVSRTIGPVSVVDAGDREPATAALVAADLAATCVGGRALPAVADALALALPERIAAGREPLNLLLAENVHECADLMRGLLSARLPDVPAEILAANLGLLETSIGRMIPVPDPMLRESDPTLVQVEPYQLLPYDAAAVVGEPLTVPGLVADASVPFSFYGERKLYLHNMGHCFAACLGRLLDLDLIWQAIGRIDVRYLVRAAMVESATALAARYGVNSGPLLDHIDDLLHRFGNRALADTTERVGRDLLRKLAPEDRLLGAYRLAAEQRLPTRHLSLAIAAAATLLRREEGWTVDRLWSYLDTGLTGVLDEERCVLLTAQLEALDDGFVAARQLALIDHTFEPSRIL